MPTKPQKTEKGWNPILVTALVIIPVMMFMFRGLFNPSQVLFSNDGPYGVMQSDWMKKPIEEGFGSPVWTDLQFLGFESGSVPITGSYFLYQLFSSPLRALGFLILPCLIGFLIAEFKYQYFGTDKERKIANELSRKQRTQGHPPTDGSEHPEVASAWTLWTLRAWTFVSLAIVGSVVFGLRRSATWEAAIVLPWALVGGLAWWCEEMLHLRVKRSSNIGNKVSKTAALLLAASAIGVEAQPIPQYIKLAWDVPKITNGIVSYELVWGNSFVDLPVTVSNYTVTTMPMGTNIKVSIASLDGSQTPNRTIIGLFNVAYVIERSTNGTSWQAIATNQFTDMRASNTMYRTRMIAN
jgi:hypothetical protein